MPPWHQGNIADRESCVTTSSFFGWGLVEETWHRGNIAGRVGIPPCHQHNICVGRKNFVTFKRILKT